MRPRALKRRLVLVGFGAIFAAVMLAVSAPHARAAGMNAYQFTGYLAAQLILVGALVFVFLVGVFRAVEWWSER